MSLLRSPRCQLLHISQRASQTNVTLKMSKPLFVTLRDLAANLSDAEKTDLLATIIDESERLNRFIANLLDMTKLESGAIVPNSSPHDLGEIVGSALQRASKILVHHKVELELATDLPMLELDAVANSRVADLPFGRIADAAPRQLRQR